MHIQHQVHVGDPDKRKHFATLRVVFLAKGTDELAKGKGWLPLDSFETGVPTVIAREAESKSIGGRRRMGAGGYGRVGVGLGGVMHCVTICAR